MGISLKDFYQDVEGETIAEEPVFSSDAKGGATPAGEAAGLSRRPGLSLPAENEPAAADPAHRTIEAGKNYAEVEATHKTLVNLLNQAKAGNNDALREIVSRYGFDADVLKITITEPLRDAQGREPDIYGIKLIHSDEEWLAITRDWETACAYFPEIELHSYATTRRNKRLAVVMGVSAHDFNAVIAAERRRTNLESVMRAHNQDIEMGRKEMGVDRMPRVPTGKDKKPLVETPSAAKAQPGISAPARGAR